MAVYSLKNILLLWTLLGAISLQAQAIPNSLFVVEPLFYGYIDREITQKLTEYNTLVTEIGAPLAERVKPGYKYTQIEGLPLGSSYILSFSLARSGLVDGQYRFVAHTRISELYTGEVVHLVNKDLETEEQWIEDIRSFITGFISSPLPFETKNTREFKKLEVGVKGNGDVLGGIHAQVYWELLAELYPETILLDAENYHYSMTIIRKLGGDFQSVSDIYLTRYRKSEHLQGRLDFKIEREQVKGLPIFAVRSSLQVEMVNMVNGQTIYKEKFPWFNLSLPIVDENVETEEPTEEPPAEIIPIETQILEQFKAPVLGKKVVAELQEQTGIFTTYRKPLKVAKVYGRWIYINAGRKRGYRIGDRLVAGTGGENVTMHVIRYYGPHLKILCPETGKVIDDGMIAYVRENYQAVQVGNDITKDPTIYPVLPKNINRYLGQ